MRNQCLLAMRMIRSVSWLGLLLAALASAHAKLNVVATLPDYGAIAEEIGGDMVKVTSLAKGTEDPHFIDARPSFLRILNQADVLAPFQQVCRERMAEGVAAGHLLHHAQIQVVAALGTGFPVAPEVLLREHPLPSPLPAGVRILSGQGVGHQFPPPAPHCSPGPTPPAALDRAGWGC